MKDYLVVGVDISKLKLDTYFMPSDVHMQIPNEVTGFRQCYKVIKEQVEAGKEVLVVMEHTGRYSHCFEQFLQKKGVPYCKVCALQIKRSMGMMRGKTDKVDSKRIASYGWLRRDIMTADQYPSQTIERLRDLISLRQKFVSQKNGYTCRLKEIKFSGQWYKSDPMVKMQEKQIHLLSSNIKELEKEIKGVIQAHKEINQTYLLLKSIKGVGLIVAAYMIACTDNFKRFANARKFNCYAGLAPFAYESGSSVRGRSRVSHLANKRAKWLLGLAASTAIQHNAEIRAYYQRRLMEGKSKMSTQNAVRAKLVARMFAVVKRQTPYQTFTVAA